ncbi:hypothetical protein Tco_0838578 [Tanacetum coccineum]|uniref:Uncharacterized protein n=1 Tax=Tanacetum coccineum TaxID=301880 RepID=A0ABQ5AN64_9ASTR
MSTSSNTTFEFDVNHNGEFKLNPLTYQDGSVLNIRVFQMDFEDTVSYLTWKIPRRFTTLYYMLPPYYTLSGMKQIKNDYHTNVMYDIAKVAGKLQIFVSHSQIDLSTVLIPNNGSLEESFAAQYKLEIYIDHIGVNFVISKYIFPNASLAEMMNHVITDYSSENEDIIRKVTQNDYTFDQMVEWAEQEHFEDEETNVSCLKTDLSSVLIPNNGSTEELKIDLSYLHQINPEQVRLNVLTKLQEALDEEAILEEQILALMHRFADRFTDRRVEINNLMVLHDHPLIEYGKYALGCMTGADMKKCVYLKSVRDELLRSMEEKRQLMTNYRDM